MNKRYFIAALIVVVVVLSGAWIYISNQASAPGMDRPDDEAALRAVILDFGKKLDMVSVIAPEEIAAKAIEENYAAFVSPDILADWKADPLKAPGRMTSNPHPDRIEILLVEKEDDGAYTVQGKVIEVITGSSEPVNEYPVSMKLRKIDGRWMITGFVKAMLQK